MKPIYQLILAAAAMMSISSCHDHRTEAANAGEQLIAGVEYRKMYRCPMNDEGGKLYKEPGRCPVCGMKLEAVQVAQENNVTYKMLFSTGDSVVAAGRSGKMTFTPTQLPGEKNVGLELQHEKKIHLIIVSEDLSYFDHVHPEAQADGSYQIRILANDQPYSNGEGKDETRFVDGGNYFLFADYKPQGSAHQVEKIRLNVAGQPGTTVRFEKQKLSGASGDFTFDIKPADGKFYAGSLVNFSGIVHRKGVQIDANSLEDYLGAKAHMVIVGLEDKDYIHVHPEVKEGKFDLHTTFKNAGTYRGWVQFQSEGKLHTIDFTIKVVTGKAEKAKTSNHAHGSDHSH